MASTYLSRTSGTTTNNKIGTFSFWVKFSKKTETSSYEPHIFDSYYSSDNRSGLKFENQKLLFYSRTGASTQVNVQTSRVFRDTNAWYHIVVAIDMTQATNTNRLKFYVNGVQETNMAATTYGSQNDTIHHFLGNVNLAIGRYGGNTSVNHIFDGILSHVHYIDGTAYSASDFGETDSTTGEWKIKTSPSVTYGNNGFFILKDGNSVTDSSSNSNDFSVTAGTLTKTEDCPSNVFATWNPLHHSTQSFSNVVLKDGNTTFDNNETSSSVYPQGYSTLAASSGKYYFESKVIATSNDASMIGISGAVTTETYVGQNAETYVFRTNGDIRNNDNTTSSWGNGWGVGDIVQIAVDLDNNKIYFGINGTWQNSGDPTSGSTGTGAAFTITAPSSTTHGVYHFTLGDTSSSGTFEHATNFGNGYFGTTAVASAGTNASGIGIFEYDVPTGYTALSTKGLNL